MENTPINLLAPFVSDTKASVTGKTSMPHGKGDNSFLNMLKHLAANSGSSPAGSKLEENGNVTPSCIADLFPALPSSAVEDLFKMLQAISGGTAVESDNILQTTADESATQGSSATALDATLPDKQVESLLLGLLALFAKKNGGTGAVGVTQTGSAPDNQKNTSTTMAELVLATDPDKKAEGASGNALVSSDGVSPKSCATDDQSTLEMLALIVFNSLQALQEKQNAEVPSPVVVGQGQFQMAVPKDGINPGTGNDLTQKIAVGGASDATQAENKETLRQGSKEVMSQGERLEKALNGILGGGEGTPSRPESDDKTATRTEITLAPPAKESSTATANLSLTISGPVKNIGQNGPQTLTTMEVIDRIGVQGGGQGESKGDSAATATIVKDLSPLLGNKDENHSHNDAGSKDGSSERQEYQFAPGNDISKAAAEGTKVKGVDQTVSAGAVEKFEKVLEQFGTKASQHDLTVRLDIGNKETLVLGFKDVGQNITVEVKASHQAITDLLQTQKDAIMKHLESKDVHTNILIDPDASATPDRRDRRETRDVKQMFANPSQEGEGFGEYLEVFA